MPVMEGQNTYLKENFLMIFDNPSHDGKVGSSLNIWACVGMHAHMCTYAGMCVHLSISWYVCVCMCMRVQKTVHTHVCA